MKVLKVLTEQWFTNSPFHEVKMLGIKHLNIPASALDDANKPENSRRALVRQVFNKSEHEYGEEFEIIEPTNPFGKVPKRRTSTTTGLTGEYRFVKCGMRAPEEDIRWKMMELMEKNTDFETLVKAWEQESGTGPRELFKATGKSHQFNFIDQVNWALARGWIVRV